jgi:serine/threonine protein kinase/Tfp pilus assembly protein PilF
MNCGHIDHQEQLEKLLFDFEQSWFKDQNTDIADFLPDPAAEDFLEILTELVRSDMEFRAERGREFLSESYFARFPVLLDSADAKKAVVFEEYRLRNARGECVTAQSLTEKHGIDSTGWPELQPAAPGQSRASLSTQAQRVRQRRINFPKVGDTFERFELVGVLGEGAFGRVYLAQQGDLEGRLVVLKLTTEKTDEHRLLARLQHTNIVPIHSVHRSNDLQAICMPLLGVATLEDILRQCGKPGDQHRGSIQSDTLVETVNQKKELSVADTISDADNAKQFRLRKKLKDHEHVQRCSSFQQFAAELIRQTAEGLGYAHRRSIVHGDLKPANLLVDDDGNAVILDFHLGSSKQEDVGKHIGGTLPYMSPEHLRSLERGAGNIQPTSDVYSAGVMLYEVMTGKLPYEEDLRTTFCLDDLATVKDVPFAVPKADRELIGEDVSAIIETCMQPKPENRFQNGFELASELERSLSWQPLQLASNGSFKNRITKWARRNPRLSSGSTILAVCSLVILAIAASLWTVSANLNKLNAISESQRHIELARSLRPSLAAAHGYHDPGFFAGSAAQAEQFLEQNSWRDVQELESRKYFGRLSADDANTEALSAAELHFWLAEVFQNLATINVDREFLSQALAHNDQAAMFWPNDRTQLAVLKQKHKIQSRIDQKGLPIPEPDLSKEPDNRLDRFLSAYLHEKDPSTAERIYSELVEESPDDFLTWLMLGNVCAEQEKFPQAEAYYTVCHSMDNRSSLPVLYRGLVRMEQGKTALALTDLKLADRLTPDDVTIKLNLALVLIKERDFEQALHNLDRAIDLGARQTRVWYLRSNVRKALGDDAGARADMEKFLTTDPQDEKSCVTRGVRKINDDPRQAIKDFERALEFNPKSDSAYNNIAHVYSEVLKEPESAIKFMDKAIEFNSANPKLVAARGVLLGRTGQRKAAIADAESALHLDGSPDTLYRVAGIYAQTSKVEPQDAPLAISLFAQAAFRDPGLVLRMMKTDPDLEPLSDKPAFTALVDGIRQLFEAGEKPIK